MSGTDREKWDARYTTGDYVPRRDPSPFLVDSLRLFPSGRALVAACGTGRNAIHLADAGFEVDGFDVSPVAIGIARAEAERRELMVNFQAVDLDDAQLVPGAYDLITVFRYTNRQLWTRLIDALTNDGWLMMEMHLQVAQPVAGPPPGSFRVEPNELLEAFEALRVVFYQEVVEPSDRGDAEYSALARLIACKGVPSWEQL